MRILDSNEYINEKLVIKPVTKDRLFDYKKPYIDEATIRFIKDNNLKWNPLSKSYDCEGDVKVSEDIVIDGKLKIRFRKVDGHFNCSDKQLTSLEGAPKEVCGYFDCSGNKLTTLECAPKKVGGHFNCSDNNLTSLEGAPNEVSVDFDCSNNNLTSLEGAPKEVGGYFDCSYNKLTTLEGTPSVIVGDFYCSGNPNIVLPKDKPSWVKGEIIS